jgi:2-polyprenyl-3-methyl-5-hydroxy-6-metoxy-1,4-benzoquinol methylase
MSDLLSRTSPARITFCHESARLDSTQEPPIMQTHDDIAEWYDAWLGSDSILDDPYFPTVETLLGNVAGLSICDLACGQVRLARHLADRGARVVGVDCSARLLEIARRYEQEHRRGIEYSTSTTVTGAPTRAPARPATSRRTIARLPTM